MSARRGWAAALGLCALWAHAGEPPADPPISLPDPPLAAAPALPPEPPIDLASIPVSQLRSGREIYENFRGGLASPQCDAAATQVRWKQHFKSAPGRLTQPNDDLLPLFGYVVDALREAGLPTEYALIPFVESGYRPGARSAGGPAGLWQFIGSTARNHGIGIREGYDGRLSPVESTQAAVRYLKTLHNMFGKDWRLAVMGYNAGEYRVLQSMRRAGMNARNARPAELPGLSGITYAYVEKLHALACLFQQADDSAEWMHALDRQVPRLAPYELSGPLDAWARRNGHDPALLKRLNPAFANGSPPRGDRPLRVLAPTTAGNAPAPVERASAQIAAADEPMPPGTEPPPATAPGARSHVVKRGESAWTIARRYGLTTQQLQALNHLHANSVLRPGMVLQVDGEAAP